MSPISDYQQEDTKGVPNVLRSEKGSGGPGALFHWVTKTPSGIRVTDVWKTREAFEKFSEEQIGPVTQEVGIPNPPTITFQDVHNYLTAD